jgi:beta-phosphoglucomutase
VIKACIFDLDGVIVDTAHYHFLAWQRLAGEIGINLTEKENERLKGVSRMDSLDIILRLGKVTMSAREKQALADKKNSWFLDFLSRMQPEEIFPGVKKLMADLKSVGIKVGLASSSKNARAVLKLLKIENLFDCFVDGTMISKSKPDPEIFLLAASKLSINPQECLVFEDAEAGVEAAIAAGMKCIGVGSQDQLSKADRVIQKTGDFKVDELVELA